MEELVYGSRIITYSKEFRDRKSIGIKVNPTGSVEVKVPVGISEEKVQRELLKKASWIVKQQEHFFNFNPIQLAVKLKSGFSIYYLGRQYRIRFSQSDKKDVTYKDNQFYVLARTKTEGERLIDNWLRERAKLKITELAKPIIEKFQSEFKKPKYIYFQDMDKRWGSCTSNDKLIFNPKLIHVPKRCIEYVIYHELCHLVHKHHNKSFFDLLTYVCPDWEERKRKLDQFV